ncbi:MAG: UDP-glucose/GDP-mannose dehydrogenase family protein [Alphaproteobacteria bacterium]|nr:UDP-glucose/GDP-mannose dehydrogenase family protein [Alphaproteobacteria bacterium]MCB1550487.1 UDP-glucose/GDP-mannose dehydrogenase family protein [Alphaproteobacteria bacterium]MCB9985982.1 UDP-glucose/GDP-mannose dehydrogenase family protein [Micavibrio sp.]HPQ50511.1 UDP-glucose/GDP-mannose dehydrogenase family protein [Alphaproteobacteria bacterium]HRK96863.1 UDP-glucose/GDP-mannose dehydrogenase family protein [Alphaproteobacteria bacterium]
MKIGVVGTGYVGLVSGTCFAEFGVEVICVDKDQRKIDMLKSGGIPIYEPGLDDLVAKQVKAGRLSFTTDLGEAVRDADAVFIAVGTPPRVEDGQADLTYVFQAAEEIAQHLQGYTIIVDKSTVPVGTARKVTEVIRKANPDADFDVVSNPEFLREGAAIDDFLRPDRVVVGVDSERAREVMRQLYRPLYINETPMVMTSPESAEITKYASNAFLAAKITFINEIANLCEAAGANVQDVAKGMGLDGRIGKKFLHAGPGYGGSCFPKDTLALVQIGQNFGAPQTLVDKVVEINKNRQKEMADRVIAACGGDVKGKKIAVLGIAFKPNTDDIREAPSLVIIPALQKAGATIAAHDPAAMENAKAVLSNVEWADDAYATMKDADALVIVTEWNEFRGLQLDRVAQLLKTKCIVDLRNIYKVNEMKDCGFQYSSIGRPSITVEDVQTEKIRAVS